MKDLTEKYPDKISSSRGLGLFCAFDCDTAETRNEIVKKCFDNGMMVLGCGEKTLRFRPPVIIKKDEIYEGMLILDKVISGL
jgi:L-lysine 6-transaminase